MGDAAPPPLENLKPALAGLIVDNEVGRKEAYATFIHLVERGHVLFSKKGGIQTFWALERGYSELEPFEAILLPPREGISAARLRESLDFMARESRFHDLVLQAAKRRNLLPSSEFSLGPLRAQELAFATALMFLFYILGAATHFNFWLLVLAIPLIAVLVGIAKWGFDSLAAGFRGRPRPDMDELKNILFIFKMYVIIPYLFLVWLYGILSNLSAPLRSEPGSRTLAVSVSGLTPEGLAQKQRYLDLFAWLKAHPLKNYRWSNEFLPYAVAFGLYKDYDKFPQ